MTIVVAVRYFRALYNSLSIVLQLQHIAEHFYEHIWVYWSLKISAVAEYSSNVGIAYGMM